VFTLFWLLMVYIVISPYLLVFGDDNVTRYTRANNILGEVGDAFIYLYIYIHTRESHYLK